MEGGMLKLHKAVPCRVLVIINKVAVTKRTKILQTADTVRRHNFVPAQNLAGTVTSSSFATKKFVFDSRRKSADGLKEVLSWNDQQLHIQAIYTDDIIDSWLHWLPLLLHSVNSFE